MSLVSPKNRLEGRYDAVVIGSGYGGGVAALRLAESGLSVCVLERGLEHTPKDFAERASEVVPQLQARIDVGGRARRVGSHLGLFDLRVHEGVSALVGCGVGGTSLINANVFVAPDDRAFAAGWPAALRDDPEGRHAASARADAILRPAPFGGAIAKEHVLARLADSLGTGARRLPLLVNDATTADEDHPPCNGCGNCVSGCRRGSKRSVDVTYLARAVALGATIFAEMDVRHVVRAGPRWAVHYAPVCRTIDEQGGPPFILADRVYLAAGALGSTELLLRSRAEGLAVSAALGTRFSGNGNCIGVLDGGAIDVRATGRADTDESAGSPGPCITAAFEVAGQTPIHVEDGTVPRLLAGFARASALVERTRASIGVRGQTMRVAQDLAATALERHYDADERGLVLLTQCDDGARGRLVLGKDGVVITWPGYGDVVAHVDRTLARGAGGLNAKYRPLRPRFFGVSGHMTVHPLGGCPMGEDAVTGVVDHTGAVFDGSSSDIHAVHNGLYVCDGAILPRAIGKNPAATITMLAERALALHLAARSTLVPIPTTTRPAASRARREAIVLAEAFDGWLTTDHAHDPALDRSDGSFGPLSYPLHAHFTIEVDDLQRFRRDPSHGASVTGVLSSPLLGERASSVVRGQVYLLADDPLDKSVFYNIYRLGLLQPSGEELLLSGMKVWQGGDPLALWGDGTQMPIEIFRGREPIGVPLAKGFLRMSARQFAGSVRSYWGKGERTVLADLGARARFVGFSLARLGERLRARA